MGNIILSKSDFENHQKLLNDVLKELEASLKSSQRYGRFQFWDRKKWNTKKRKEDEQDKAFLITTIMALNTAYDTFNAGYEVLENLPLHPEYQNLCAQLEHIDSLLSNHQKQKPRSKAHRNVLAHFNQLRSESAGQSSVKIITLELEKANLYAHINRAKSAARNLSNPGKNEDSDEEGLFPEFDFTPAEQAIVQQYTNYEDLVRALIEIQKKYTHLCTQLRGLDALSKVEGAEHAFNILLRDIHLPDPIAKGEGHFSVIRQVDKSEPLEKHDDPYEYLEMVITALKKIADSLPEGKPGLASISKLFAYLRIIKIPSVEEDSYLFPAAERMRSLQKCARLIELANVCEWKLMKYSKIMQLILTDIDALEVPQRCFDQPSEKGSRFFSQDEKFTVPYINI
jgi:hypothetical protein